MARDMNRDGTAYGPCEACGGRYRLLRQVYCRRAGRWSRIWACDVQCAPLVESYNNLQRSARRVFGRAV